MGNSGEFRSSNSVVEGAAGTQPGPKLKRRGSTQKHSKQERFVGKVCWEYNMTWS